MKCCILRWGIHRTSLVKNKKSDVPDVYTDKEALKKYVLDWSKTDTEEKSEEKKGIAWL